MLHAHIEPLTEHPFHAHMRISRLPGLVHVSSNYSPASISRTKELLQDADGALVVHFAESEILTRHLGREAGLSAGSAMAMSHAEIGSVSLPTGGCFSSLILPTGALRSMLRSADDRLAQPIPAHSTSLRLLKGYLELVGGAALGGAPDVLELAATHVYDLVALALSATRDAAEVAKGRGLSAAHIHAIKKYVIDNLACALSLESVASRHRISPRYVQKLFEREGTSFTEFVRDARLECVHRMLSNPRFERMQIAEIAYATGFNDLLHFNRQFRVRYGCVPSDVRHSLDQSSKYAEAHVVSRRSRAAR